MIDTHPVLKEWDTCLYGIEDIYYAQWWAICLLESFLDDPSMESLKKAQCGIATANRVLKNFTFSGTGLTSEDYRKYQDYELSIYIPMLVSSLTSAGGTLETSKLWTNNLMMDCFSFVYWKPELEYIRYQIAFEKALIEEDCRFFWNTTNMILLELDMDDSIWQEWIGRHSFLSRFASDWVPDQETLEEKTAGLLDGSSAKLNPSNSGLTYNKYLLQTITDEENLISLYRKGSWLSKLPENAMILPFNLIEEEWNIAAFSSDGDESEIIRPGDDLKDKNLNFYYTIEGSAEDFLDYLGALKSYNFPLYASDDNTDHYLRYYLIDEYPGCSFTWEKGKITVFSSEHRPFLPFWYFEKE